MWTTPVYYFIVLWVSYNWVLCLGSHRTKIRGSVGLSRRFWKECFHVHSDCWQNSGSCGCGSEVLVFLPAAGQAHSLLLQDTLRSLLHGSLHLSYKELPSCSLSFQSLLLFCHQLEKTLCLKVSYD